MSLEFTEKIELARKRISALCKGDTWRMSIPVQRTDDDELFGAIVDKVEDFLSGVSMTKRGALVALSSEPEPGEFEFIFDPHDTYLGMTEQQWDRLHECKVKVKAIRQEKSE